MKVALVLCAVGIAGFNANYPQPRPIGDREGSWISHGLASIGASVKAAGYRVELIDLRQLSGLERFEQIVKWSPADVYGLSVSAVDYTAALQVVSSIKNNAPNSKIIVGGIHPTIFPEDYAFDAIDCVVQGEGEITFCDLLKRIKMGDPIPKLVRGEKPDLNALPWVDRHLFDYRRELDCFFAPGQQTPSITMLAGRGCAYHCNYCQPAENAVFGKPYRMRSPQNVIDELVALKRRYNYKSITFWDDTFTFRKDWIAKFCDLYKTVGIKATIAACSRADIICDNEEMVKRLAEIGLDWFVVGIESGSQRLLDLIRKGTTVNQNREAVEISHRYGIKVFGTFMLGLPTETREESLATVNLIHEANIDLASPFFFLPIRGTGLYDYCERNDLILPVTKERTIARTGVFEPTIRGVDYDYINSILPQVRGI